MNKNFDATVSFMQLLLLVLWEGLGAVYFGWSPVAVFLVWLVGIFTLNIGVATVLRTFIKLTRPPVEAADNVVNNVVNINDAAITEDDIG
jgi:hypothetical protein